MKVKQRRAIFFLLAVPLLLMIGMLSVLFYYGGKKIAKGYETIAEMSANDVQSSVISFLEDNKNAVENYFAPFFYKQKVFDPASGDSIMVFTDRYKGVQSKRETAYLALEGILPANPGTYSICFVYSDSVKDPDFKLRGFAPLVSRDGRRLDLGAGGVAYSSALYKHGLKSVKPFFSKPVQLPEDSTVMIVTYCVPVFSDYDTSVQVGQIWLDINLKSFCDILSSACFEEGVNSMIISRNHRIIATNTYTNLGETELDYFKLDTLKHPQVYKNILKLAETKVHTTKDVSFIDGINYFVYTYPLEPFDMILVISMPKSDVYQEISSFKRSVVLTSCIGALLMLLCSAFVFRTYNRNYRRQAKVKHELDIASKIQKSFLPSEHLQIEKIDLYATTKAAEEIGGDLYDYVVKGDKMYFCLGDVSGKSIPASIMMSMASSLFRAVVSTTDNAADIAYVINNALAERNKEFMFCTMFIGVIDTRTGELNYCNAGHNPPVVLNKDGYRYLNVKANCPLGLVKGRVFVGESDVLDDNQMLFLYSDGVTEARSAFSVLFGENRLLKVLKKTDLSGGAEGIVESVGKAVAEFARGARQSDDITMLCIRRK